MLKITNNRNTFYQWDIGQSLTVESVAGQTISEVHIGTCASNLYVVEPVNGLVAVYDELLQTGDDIIAYEFIRNNSTSAYTTKKYKFPVVNRPKATDYAYTPTTSYSWEYWCERARLHSVAAADSVNSIPATMTAWWTAHMDDFKGEDGEDGISPTASVTKVGTKSTITITDANGTTTAEVLDGASGSSAKAVVEQTSNGAVIYCTDEDGTTTATIRNGTDGQTQDLTVYVKNTDYATADKGGVIKAHPYYGARINENGILVNTGFDYATYQGKDPNLFISKGTLENVLANRLAGYKKYRLIADFTITNTTANWVVSNDANNNPIDLSDAIIYITAPIKTDASVTNNGGYIRITDVADDWVNRGLNFGALQWWSDSRVACSVVEIHTSQYHYPYALINTTAPNFAYASNSARAFCVGNAMRDNFTSIKSIASTKNAVADVGQFVSGTRIVIMGVDR